MRHCERRASQDALPVGPGPIELEEVVATTVVGWTVEKIVVLIVPLGEVVGKTVEKTVVLIVPLGEAVGKTVEKIVVLIGPPGEAVDVTSSVVVSTVVAATDVTVKVSRSSQNPRHS